MKVLCPLWRPFFRFQGISSSYSSKMPRRQKRSQHITCDASSPFSLQNVVKKIETFAPRYLAESWDNVGLLVEPSTPAPIKRILLTNDLSELVLKEAIHVGAQLIISYHPLIFPSLKTLNAHNWKEHIISTLLQEKIALYSPHTAWDCVEGGVNDWLAQAFGPDASVKPLKPYDDGQNRKIVNALFGNSGLADQAVAALQAAGSFTVHSFNERDGKVWLKICTDNEYLCLPHLVSAIDVDFAHHKMIPSRVNAGVGRRVVLKHKITLQTAIDLVKKHLGLSDLAVAVVPDENIETTLVGEIALCAGSGGSVLKGVDADLYLTGEMSHHEVLDTVHKGIHVILTRHSNSERGFLKVAANHHLKNLMPEIEFLVSTKDRDPLETK